MDIRIKQWLFGLLLLLLFAPIIQQQTRLFELPPLRGTVDKKQKPSLSINNWNSADYQDSLNTYLKYNTGFRSLFIRSYNQQYYSLFNQAKAKAVVIGKDGYLYEENYIKAYYGTDYIGAQAIADKVGKLKAITDTLKKQNIDLVVVLAPGKGSYYPQYIPKALKVDSIGTTNYEVFRDQFTRQNIPFLDFKNWFDQVKDTTQYPLFPKTGIHWSKYGEYLAADSMIKYIEKTTDRDLPDLKYKGMHFSSKMRSTDDDIEKGMNLLFDIPDLEMAYPKFEAMTSTADNPVTVMTMADSYFWGMFNWDLAHNTFNRGEFWYYNQLIYGLDHPKPVRVEDVNIPSQLQKNDVIILMSTDANLYKFGFGFIDQAYEQYFNPDVQVQFLKLVESYERAIRNEEKWLQKVSEKAVEKGISVEEMIHLDAIYMAKNE